MSMQKAKKRIAQCREQQSTELDLSDLGLTALPPELFELTWLTSLKLGYMFSFGKKNQLTELSPEIAQLANLTSLDLNDNELSTLPDSITQLTNLTELGLGYNELSTLPDSITQLTNLQRLDLSVNQLYTLPDSITQLANLTELDLSYNQLSALPDSIAQLTNLLSLSLRYNELSTLPHSMTQLTNLLSLSLRDNQLHTLPDSITQLTNLQSLHLSSNCLSTLPDPITRLANLQRLYLGRNQLSTLPDSIIQLVNLRRLDLRANQLSTLPDSIIQLTSLRRLDLDNNPLTFPPMAVAWRGIGAIRAFLAEHADVPLYESKLLLVGEGRVGKTSLSKALRISNYALEDEQSTEGIDIQHWILPKEETGLAEDFRLNVWDFGGQEIYHATHQFFFTRRSLYLLVTESRQEDKHDDFYYWFNVIRLLGDEAPVVVVLNKCDQPVKELPMEEYKKAFDNIVAYEKVSCAPDYKETIGALRAVICRLLKDEKRMAHVGDKLPGVWLQIRDELAELREQGLGYISHTRFREICAEHNMVEEERVKLLGGYFHDLGIFLHFADDWELSEMVILNPEWATDGVYKVLDNGTVKAQSGRFTDDNLRDIWSHKKYQEKRRELLALMKNTKFELCYELPWIDGQKQGYLAPQLLPVDEMTYEWRAREENLRFEYRYTFMPKGILTRFIVKRHKNVVQAPASDSAGIQPLHWRYGVLLRWGDTRALVRERYFEKKITIVLEGEDKLGFLAIIRHSIEEIHGDFKNLQVDEMVPCNCDECRGGEQPHFFRHELLRRYLRKGRYDIICDVSLDDVDVRTLLRETIPTESQRPGGHNIYVGGDYIDGDSISMGDIEDSEKIAVGRGIDQRLA